MTFPIPPEHITADATVALLTLVERYGAARQAADFRNALNDADLYEKRIAARDLLEQLRQQLDPNNLLAVCPACAQLVRKEGDGLERHRRGWRADEVCNPARTLAVLLAGAQRRAQVAAQATAGIFPRR